MMLPAMPDVLVLYYSATGSVRALAQSVARGIESVEDMRARVRTVPKVAPVIDKPMAAIPSDGPPYVEARDLEECVAIALGSPTRFGNMAAPLKYFIDGLGPQWGRGTLSGKPAAVFSSTASMHGGQEATLISMMLPLFHHGMILVGLPYTEADHKTTRSGGTPNGPTPVSGMANDRAVSDEESRLAFALGKRLAGVARSLCA
jgi:NAD(P)H dehydrogenase (quinone)